MRLLFIVFLLLAAAQPAQAAERTKRTKVAVPEVTPRGGVEPGSLDGLGAVLAEEAGKLPGLDVLSAAEIRAMIGLERQKELLGCAETSCLAEIGGALGVDLLLASEVSKIGGQWLVSVSLVDVRSSRVLARATRESPRDDALLSAAREAAGQALEAWAPREPGWTGGELASAGLVGGGALLGVVGVVLLVTGAAEVEDAVGGSTVYDAAAQEKEQAGQSKQTAGAILTVAGGAALAGGVVAWQFSGGEESSLSLAPMSGGGRLAWSLRF